MFASNNHTNVHMFTGKLKYCIAKKLTVIKFVYLQNAYNYFIDRSQCDGLVISIIVSYDHKQ